MQETNAALKAAITSFADGKLFRNWRGEKLDLAWFNSLFDAAISFSGSWGYKTEYAEVVNILFDRLNQKTSSGKRFVEYVTAAKNPHAYLSTCLISWIREEKGLRSLSINRVGELQYENDLESSAAIADLEKKILRTLTVLVPKNLAEELDFLVGYFLANPPERRSYEWIDRQCAVSTTRKFSEEQVGALMNILWGTRLSAKDSSLVAAFLLEPDFSPFASAKHAAALLRFKKSMHRKTRIV